MTPAPRSGNLRRYLALALLAGLLMAPSPAWAIGLLAAAVVARTAGPVRRRLATRRAQRIDRRGAQDGVLLGRDPARRPVRLTDAQLAAHALIVGASGSGKTTTLLSIVCDQIARGNPVVAIDMKGSPAFARTLARAAGAAGRELRIWTPDGPCHWNPLAHGNATALKDKLISTERFTEPHYMRAAERYVQTVLQVVHARHPERPAALDEVVALMEPRRLGAALGRVPISLAERVQDYLDGLTPDQVSAARGLGTRLALLTESSAGTHLAPGPPATTIDLRRALAGDQVVLFSLNSSVYGKLAAQLGALAIQDLTSATGERLEHADAHTRPATVAIDEFSALGADNLLALVARGREAGTHVLAATQELADLERAARGFADQVVGITGVKIIHRQEVPSSALMLARMIGTERVWEQTRQIPSMFASPGSSRGMRREVERFLVDPNEIKTLQAGEAVVLTKSPVAQVTRLRVQAASPPAAAVPSAASARFGPGPPTSAAAGPGPPASAAAGPEPPMQASPGPAPIAPPAAGAQRRRASDRGRGSGGRPPGGPDHPAPGVTR